MKQSVEEKPDDKFSSDRRLGGILIRRPRWGLSWLGWLLILLVLVTALIIFKFAVYSFLAPSRPAEGEILVVEGWVPNYALDQSIAIFRKGHYKKILASGGQAKGEWSIAHGVTYAMLAAQYLRYAGFDSNLVAAATGDVALKDRTYNSALGVKQWLNENCPSVTKIDLLTLGPHARRSQMLFQEAMGDKIMVGIISLPDRDYDPQHWWRTSDGVRDVISETIAYVYAKFFFSPSGNHAQNSAGYFPARRPRNV